MFDLVITGLELSRKCSTAARENGFREMLLKPYHIQELSSTVRRVLDKA